jgi:hypothetical protein
MNRQKNIYLWCGFLKSQKSIFKNKKILSPSGLGPAHTLAMLEADRRWVAVTAVDDAM